jgi:hypothetical protein
VPIADLRIGNTEDNAETSAREEATMPNPSQQRTEQQTAANGARLILLREKLRQLNPAFDESTITLVVLPDGSRCDPRGQPADAPPPPEVSLQGERDGTATCKIQPLYDTQSTEQPHCELDRGPSATVGLLRCAGAIIGFVTGGPTGAAVGSMLAVVAGEIIAERSFLIWLKLKSIALWRTRRNS